MLRLSLQLSLVMLACRPSACVPCPGEESPTSVLDKHWPLSCQVEGQILGWSSWKESGCHGAWLRFFCPCVAQRPAAPCCAVSHQGGGTRSAGKSWSVFAVVPKNLSGFLLVQWSQLSTLNSFPPCTYQGFKLQNKL